MITGSNASLLSKELGTRLTGRHLKHELFPFSYQEFLNFTSKKIGADSFGEYLKSGGFPEYLLYCKTEILQELFNDIIMRDIVVRHKLRSPKVIKEMALYLITNVGVEFSYNNLAKTFNLGSTNSAVAFVSYLEDSYLIFTVSKFDYSLKKQMVNPKKVYSIDNGLSSANSISFSSNKGRMLENWVFLDLKRTGKEIFYFKGERECDFLVREKNKITAAIQVCYELNEENKERELSGLVEALEKFNLTEGAILTYNQEDELKVSGKTVFVKPAWRWAGTR
jgi:predicted AAA+ superfamily ATPase